jgi:radical SAM protein (TIGR01212 family)
LKLKYEEALAVDDVVGLIIATRSDCLDDAKLDYLAELSQKHYLVLEIGIESCYNDTLMKINRQEKFEDIKICIHKAVNKGIKVGAHLIFGLPGETKDMMLNEAEIINTLGLYSLKMHQLQIIEGTTLAQQYRNSELSVNFFELNEYLNLVVDFVEKLDPNIIIERIANEVPPRFLLSPSWGKIRNDQIMQKFNDILRERDSFQGKILGR